MGAYNPAQAIVESLMFLADVKKQKQLEEQFSQIAPIMSNSDDNMMPQEKISMALNAISGQKRPSGIGGVFDAINPFSPYRGSGSQLEQQLLSMTMGGNKPMTPLDMATIQWRQNQSKKLEKETELLGKEKPLKPKEQLDQKTLDRVNALEAKPKEQWTKEESAWYDKALGGGGTSVTVNTGDLEKSVRASTQKEIIDLDSSIQSLDQNIKNYKDEYSTYWGKGKKWVLGKIERLDPSLVGKEDKQFVSDYNNWYIPAKAEYLTFRKWATGVAGGEREMQEIQKAFPDADNMSPSEFRSALEAARNYKQTYKQVLQNYLAEGIDIDDKKVRAQISQKALSNFGSLSQPSPEEALAELKRRGVIK